MRAILSGLVCLSVGSMLVAASDQPATLAAAHHLNAFAFCPGGQSIAAREGSAAWMIDWPSGRAREVEGGGADHNLPPCASPALGFSSDGKWWASLAEGRSGVVVRDAVSGHDTRRLSGHLGTVYAATFSPDGRYLASGGADNDVHVWDASTWEMVKTIDSMTYTPFALAWAPDSSVLYVGGSSRTVMAWSSATWSLLRSSSPQRFAVAALAVSPDGRTVAAGGVDPDGSARPAAVLLLEAATLSARRTVATMGPPNPVAFSPDGRALVALVRGQPGLTVWALE